jgi:hypothetical protein
MKRKKNNGLKHRKSDILWKVVMEEVFDDLLRFIFPDADKAYNMSAALYFSIRNSQKCTRNLTKSRIPGLPTNW